MGWGRCPSCPATSLTSGEEEETKRVQRGRWRPCPSWMMAVLLAVLASPAPSAPPQNSPFFVPMLVLGRLRTLRGTSSGGNSDSDISWIPSNSSSSSIIGMEDGGRCEEGLEEDAVAGECVVEVVRL